MTDTRWNRGQWHTSNPIRSAASDPDATYGASKRDRTSGTLVTMTDDPLARDPLPLRGRSIVVTGVSRRSGIGYATACRLAAFGANLCCHHFAPHDNEQPWGGDDIDVVLAEVRTHLVGDARIFDVAADLSDPSTPAEVVATARDAFGRLDGLVCNQALSGSDGTLTDMRTEWLDAHWAVNARASILLAQAFDAHHDPARPGAIVFLTSGQALGAMPAQIAYVASKAAIAGVTATIAEELAGRNIRVNTVNPGPVDTGWMDPALRRELEPRFASGRIGEPDDAARLISWLLTDEAAWITGQVIDSEGGFGR